MWLGLKSKNGSFGSKHHNVSGPLPRSNTQARFCLKVVIFLQVMTQIERKKCSSWLEFVPLGSPEMPEPYISNMLRIADDGWTERVSAAEKERPRDHFGESKSKSRHTFVYIKQYF